MAFILKDRVKENTSTTGTSSISLGGASATFETFQQYLTDGDTTFYALVHTTSGVDEWEVGLGTWNTGNTLTRTTVLSGSNGTSAVDFSSGNKDVFMTYPASNTVVAGEDAAFANVTVTGNVDGRDIAADGSKLDGIDISADVTDASTVAAAGALMRSGGTMTGNLILNVDPNAALGAATKQYVDTIASAGIHYHAPVRTEHPSNLNATYNNGSSGVGATLTNAGTNAALVIDSVSMVLNDRVLVANQTNQTQNGVYTVTTVGNGSTAWVLTRSTDTNTAAPSDPDAFGKGDAFFIKEGSTNAGHLDVLSTSGTIVFGTTNIVFSEVAETTVYSGGTGITLTGTTFSIGQDVGTTDNVTFNQVTAAIIGNVTGNITGNISGNAGTATKLATARTVQLSGDVTGSASFDGTANINITAAVQDDSHAHVISNVDGLQTALDAKVPTSRTITAGNGLTGGGDLTANRTLTVGGGSGITVNANDIAIDSSYTGFDGRYYTETEADSRFVNVAGDTIQTLQIGTNTVTTTSDIALNANVAINAENSLSFGMTDGTSGYYRWMFGNTSNTGGTAGGTEKMRLNKDGDLTLSGTVDGVDIAARDAVLTTTTTTANAALPKAGGTMTGDLNLGDNDIRDINRLNFNNHEGDDLTTVTGDVLFDENFYSDTEYGSATIWSGANGGGLAVYNEDGWGRILTDRNMQWLTATFDGLKVGSNNVFHDGYHPNADAWTTSRTLSLSGDASGSVSWSGSADATLSVTVANDSHTHDGRYFTETESDARFVRKGVGYTWTATGANKLSFRSENTIDTASGNQAALEVLQDDAGHDAFMQFHVVGDYAKYFGLHGGINDFVVGGWSHGASYQRVFHDGYHPNADTLTTARTINGVSFNGSANITVADSTKLPLSGGTMTGELQINARLDVGTGTQGDAEVRIYKGDNNVSDHIQFYNGTTRMGEIGCEDTTWLRINQETAKNIYTPRYIRSDGGFFVDGTTKGINGSGNFIGGTITGASDANVSNWNTAYTTANAALPKAGGTMTGDLTIPAKIIHSGDTDTYFEFHGANLARIVIAGAEVQEWGNNYTLFSDGDAVRLGSGSDFRMWHDGTHTYLRNYNHPSGNIYFQGEDTEGTNHGLVYMRCDTSSPYVQLFQNGGERLRTLSGGVGVTGLTVGDVDANPHNASALFISTSATDEKIVLSGSSNPYIRFQELTTDKAYIRWQTDGYLAFNNQESGNFRFRSHAVSQAVNIKLEASDGDVYGSVYGTHANEIGFLDQDGNWAYRHARDSLHEWRINNVVEMSLSASTLDMKNNAIDNVNQINMGSEVILSESTDRVDLLQITSSTSGWAGLQIRNSSNEGRWSFMTNGAESGIYDDENNEWGIKLTENSDVELYHNGVKKLETSSNGIEMSGRIDMNNNDIYGCDQLFHHGDTNTYMQFHAADQWRVVVGGSERLEVKNSSPHVLVAGDLNSTSDERLKKNIKPIDNALADICQLEGVTFDWRDTGTQGQGFIAQQVEPIIPDVVNTDEDTGMKSINYVGLIGHLVEAIKTQQTQIDDLKAEIQSMKS